MSNIVKFGNANLPAAADLVKSLQSLDRSVPDVGAAIIKMDRFGSWVFGADQTEVEDGSEWAVNPFSFVHGYIAWGEGEVLGEIMKSVTEPLPELPPAPPNAKKGWESQLGMRMQCVKGADVGLEVKYSTTSVGGRRAVQQIALAVAGQIQKDQDSPVPVVTLGKESYVHRQYGKIFAPVIGIQRWISLEGDKTEAPAAEATETAPRRRRTV
jgi:hypothetical protein